MKFQCLVYFLIVIFLSSNSCKKDGRFRSNIVSTKLEATVIDVNTGKPVPNAWVVLYWQRNIFDSPPEIKFPFDSVQTDANGKCSVHFKPHQVYEEKIKPAFINVDEDLLFFARAHGYPYFSSSDYIKLIPAKKTEFAFNVKGCSLFKINYRKTSDSLMLYDAASYEVGDELYDGENGLFFPQGSTQNLSVVFRRYSNGGLRIRHLFLNYNNSNSQVPREYNFQGEYLKTKEYEIPF